MTVEISPQFGDGIYSYSEAAAILGRGPEGISPSRVRSWIRTGLAPPTFRFDQWGILSFLDLVSLEVVRRLRNQGVSLQRVRHLEAMLRRDNPTRERPLAHEVFFTDGASIWVQEFGERNRNLTEVVGRHPGHFVWTEAVASFATEIRFDQEDKRAVSWSPNRWVDIDPTVQFGTPVVAGTRTPIRTIQANLRAGTPRQVAEWYDLKLRQVVGVRNYLATT